MSLEAEVSLRLGGLDLDVALDVADGEMVAVLGPNGAGKSTLLRAVAGLVRLQRGRVVVDGEVLEAPPRVAVPPERRRIGVVFQDYLLFPHLDATDNVAFGLRAAGMPRREARRRATAWLERLGLAEHARSRPRALSGGQAQRVAVARALVTEPRLLLLDEPLAAVDVSARGELRHALRRAMVAVPGSRVLVTHDPLEAATLADRALVVEEGRVTQVGTVAEVTARPRSPWVAEMVGLNLWRGWCDGAGTVTLPSGAALAAPGAPGGDVLAVIHPHAVTLHREAPVGSARNVFAGQAREVDLYGDRVRVQVTGAVPLVAEVTAGAVAELHLDEGGPVWVAFKATELDVYRS